MGRDFTSILDVSPAEMTHLLDLALGMKRDGPSQVLRGQTLAMIFEKPSLRTRTSFEMAMHRLGGNGLYLSAHEVRMGDREPVRDVARVLSRMVQAIAARTYEHTTIV
ncbi:MAG: ornithine carbamoyltransferase, partial [Dehalococcoidia bacterium]